MDTQWDRVYKRRAAEDLSKGGYPVPILDGQQP